jgi:hypothetical protein
MGKPLPSDALLEVMSADKNNIYVRHLAFDPDLKSAKETANHLITTTGFVDDDYFHRGYWSWSHNLNRYRTAWVRAAGFIMAIDGQKAYAYARKREYYIGHIKGFERHLCSMDLIPKQEPLHKEPGTTPSQGRYSRMIGKYIEKGVKLHWSDDIPILVKAMTVAHDKLIVSGPAFSLNPSAFLVDESTDDILLGTALSNRSAASEVITKADKGLKGEIPPRLMIYDKNSGEQRFSMELESIPVFDGMIAASGKLYIGLEDGTVVCMGN